MAAAVREDFGSQLFGTWPTNIRRNLPELIQQTNFNMLIESALISENIISREDVQKLRLEKARDGKLAQNRMLYEMLMTRARSYQVLAKALYDTQQTGALLALQQGKRNSSGTEASVEEELFLHKRKRELDSKKQPPPSSQSSSTATAAFSQKQAEAGDVDLCTFIPGVPSSDAINYMEEEQALHIKITLPRTKMEFADDHYKLPCDSKGLALIINIRTYEKAYRNRAGAEWDTEYMTNLWFQLGYEVYYVDGYCTKQSFMEALRMFKSKIGISVKSCVVFIGSHGVHNQIVTSDNRLVDVHSEVVAEFNHANCPYLRGKPKVFLIQVSKDIETEKGNGPSPPEDTTICITTTVGKMEGQHMAMECRYTYCLAKVFMKNAYNTDFYGLLKMTQEELRNVNLKDKLTPAELSIQWHMRMNKLYFNIAATPSIPS